MKKLLFAAVFALFGVSAVFAEVGPEPTVTGLNMPCAQLYIQEIRNFKIENKIVNNKTYVWLTLQAVIANPTGSRVRLKNFVISAKLYNPKDVAWVLESDENGNPVEKILFPPESSMDIGMFSSKDEFEISANDSLVRSLTFGLGAVCDAEGHVNMDLVNRLREIFNTFTNEDILPNRCLLFNGVCNPGILSKNGAWVFDTDRKYQFEWNYKIDGAAPTYKLSPTELAK